MPLPKDGKIPICRRSYLWIYIYKSKAHKNFHQLLSMVLCCHSSLMILVYPLWSNLIQLGIRNTKSSKSKPYSNVGNLPSKWLLFSSSVAV